MFVVRGELETFRDALRTRATSSIVLSGSRTSAELIEAMQVVEQWGPFVEAMYLMMAVDRRALNVEREVLRGALAVLSGETVRTRHMEAMLDAASRNVAAQGADIRFQKVVESLREDQARAESAVVVAAAIAVADGCVVPEEHAMLQRLCKALAIEDTRAQHLLDRMRAEVVEKRRLQGARLTSWSDAEADMGAWRDSWGHSSPPASFPSSPSGSAAMPASNVELTKTSR